MSIIPVEVPTGAIRYNTDSNKMECFDGTKWWEIAVSSPDLNGGARGVFMGGSVYPSTKKDEIDYITISSAGNAIDFGNLTSAVQSPTGFASATRAFSSGGIVSSETDTIEYVTFSSLGNATDFGNLTDTKEQGSGLSNATRGIYAGGYNAPSNVGINIIDYVTMSSAGNAVDFGDLTALRWGLGSFANPIRGIMAGGRAPGASQAIDFITIPTKGNAQDFGDLSVLGGGMNNDGCSNATRGVWMGGYNAGPAKSTNIETVMIASLGNSVKFGDMGSACALGGAVASPVRGVAPLGDVGGSVVNTIEYISLQTAGDAVDFGDLTVARCILASGSNAHGGL